MRIFSRKLLLLLLFQLFSFHAFTQNSWIRVNQVGFLEEDVKVAVWISKEERTPDQFELTDAITGNVVYHGEKVKDSGGLWGFDTSARLDFSAFTVPGTYIIRAHDVQSAPFKIGNDVYAGAAEIPLRYMRQQRCGYNPFLQDSCHTQDAISVGDPKGVRDGIYFNTTGGWHDASDYLQYVATSANAVYQMLFASTLGKYASSFSLGSRVLADYYPDFAEMLQQKAADAYRKGVENPGVSQTAPGGAPYFYEEDNWADDMQLAAAEMYHTFSEGAYLKQAVNYGRLAPGVQPVGYPTQGDTPDDPHSAFTHLHQIPVTGGIVDGPIYHSIFSSLIGIYLADEDEYADFQSDYVVYHDDYADYSTNEPTMDGAASLTYYLGYLTANADYTTPEMRNYLSSETIYRNIMAYEEREGLNGFLLLMHIGTDPERTDKLYNRLDELIKALQRRGYQFVRIDELIK